MKEFEFDDGQEINIPTDPAALEEFIRLELIEAAKEDPLKWTDAAFKRYNLRPYQRFARRLWEQSFRPASMNSQGRTELLNRLFGKAPTPERPKKKQPTVTPVDQQALDEVIRQRAKELEGAK